MIDVDEECKRIEGFEFFSNMGGCGPKDNNYKIGRASCRERVL